MPPPSEPSHDRHLNANWRAAWRAARPAHGLVDYLTEEAMTAREGLEKARSFIEAERQHRIDSFTIGGDYATADESEIGYLAEVDDALAAVTDALATLSAPAPDEVVVLPTIEQSSIVALNQAIAKICDLEELAIERSDDDHDDGDDPNSYGEGYDSGYIFGLRDAKGAVEELAAAQAALVERAKGVEP